MSSLGELKMSTWVVYCAPMGKPRMTQRDKWLNPPRKCVQKYRNLKDQLLSLMGPYPADPHIVSAEFYLPMPKSWPKRKKEFMAGQMHRQKPDLDNLMKFLGDSLFPDDSRIAAGTYAKYWAETPERVRMEITMTWREE